MKWSDGAGDIAWLTISSLQPCVSAGGIVRPYNLTGLHTACLTRAMFIENNRNQIIMYEQEISMKVRELPDRMRGEVLDYIDFLLTRPWKSGTKVKMFSSDWEDGLADIGKGSSSVELQHRALE